MDYKIIWSDAATSDLHSICSYIAQRNPQAASAVARGILNHVRILSSFPFIGPSYPRGANGTLREIVFRPYRIFYDVGEDSHTIEILHVWHGARNEPKL